MEKDGAMLQKKDGARIIPFPPEFCMKRCMTIMMTKHGATASDDSMSRKTKEVAGAKNAALRKKRMTEVARTTNAAVRKNNMTVMCRISRTTQAAGDDLGMACCQTETQKYRTCLREQRTPMQAASAHSCLHARY